MNRRKPITTMWPAGVLSGLDQDTVACMSSGVCSGSLVSCYVSLPAWGTQNSPALKVKPNIRTTTDMIAKPYPSIVTNIDNLQFPHNRRKCERMKDEIAIATKRTPISRTLRDVIGFLSPVCLSSISLSPQIYCFISFVMFDFNVYLVYVNWCFCLF